jgi:Mce-associated membrane protein
MDTLTEDTSTETPAPRSWRDTPPLTALAGAVALILVAAVVFSLLEWSRANGKVSNYQRADALRASAQKSAIAYGTAFGSYNYRDLHGQFAPWTLILSHSSAQFKADYQKTSTALEPTIVQYKATAKAAIPVSAVSSATSAKAVVLLLLSQTITNSTQKNGPQTQQFLVTMTLVRQHGQWIIDNVQASI